MKIESKTQNQIGLKTIIRRFEYGMVYKLRDSDKMKKAMKVQDEIRKKTKGGSSSTKEIRKWRDPICYLKKSKI